MNILPKKRWHVRTKDNVARVRRDQAKAKEEEERRLQRASLAEQEARTSLLRQRAATQRESDGIKLESSYSIDQAQSSGGHVNFFADLEEQERTFGANKEHEREKRLEKEAEERKIGLLKYLGEGSSEYMKETPWYQKAPKRDIPMTKSSMTTAIISTKSTEISTSESQRREEKRKVKKSGKKKHRRKRSRDSTSNDESSFSEDDDLRAKKKRSETTTSAAVDIERLRAERLRREREERLKAEAVLRKMKGEKEDQTSTSSKEHYEQRYSSQFNPDLARQNRR